MDEHLGFWFCDVWVELGLRQLKQLFETLLFERPHLNHHVHESEHRSFRISWARLCPEALRFPCHSRALQGHHAGAKLETCILLSKSPDGNVC
jgi:hypothetical protein